METLILYFGKLILCSAVLFGYYLLMLKHKTFHQYNRFYLLSAVVVSLFLPLLKVSYFTVEVNADFYPLFEKINSFNHPQKNTNDLFYFELIILGFGLVAIFLLARFLYGILKIRSFRRNFPKQKMNGISFYQTNLVNAPFSFFRNLFWKDSILLNSDLGRQILKHEMVHIEQKHTHDKIFMELATGIFWFNPVFWFIKKEINLIHEYLADKKALENSDTKAFAQMLLANHFSGKEIPATSPFFNSNLKKRLIMLRKSKTKFGYARKILVLPVLFILGFIYLVNAKNKEITATNNAVHEMVTVSDHLILSDTIKTNSPEQIQANIEKLNNQIKPTSKAIQEKQSEIAELSDEMKVKGEELRKLSEEKDFDNPKFDQLSTEMDELGKQMDDIFNSADMKDHWIKMEEHFKTMDQQFAALDRFYKSDEFRNRFKNAEEMEKKFNSPEFQKRIKDAEKRASDAEKRVISPEFQKRIKDAEKRAKEAEKRVNSPEFQQRIKEAEKRAEEAAKRMSEKSENMNVLKNSQKKPKVYVNEVEYHGDLSSIPSQNIETINVKKENENKEIWIYTKDSSVKFKSQPRNLSFEKDVYDEIYINGRLSTLQELNSIKNDNIENINVKKATKNGARKNVIKITTKK